MRTLTTVLAAALLVAAAPEARAQARRGVFAGVGAGLGTARLTCRACPDLFQKRQSSRTYGLRLGTTVNGYVALGAEINRWTVNDDFETRTRLLDLTAAVYVYPDRHGFFFKAGAGFSRATVEPGPGRPGPLTKASGLGLMAGGGYDVAIGRVLAVTPMVTYWRGSPGDLSFDGVTRPRNVRHNVLELGVGITLY
jgi:hypothetical protein